MSWAELGAVLEAQLITVDQAIYGQLALFTRGHLLNVPEGLDGFSDNDVR